MKGGGGGMRFAWLCLGILIGCVAARALDGIRDCPAKFVTALCAGPDGALWVAGEDSGVFCLRDGQWSAHRSGAPGFPATKNFSAVAADRDGRIWVGTMDRGIAVYNGKEWRGYDVLTGPSSARVYGICCSPNSGTVAIAHANGVTLWHPDTDSWQDVSALNGLPRSPVRAVCFAADDSLWMALECGGVASASAADRYRKCAVIQSKWVHDSATASRYPLQPMGKGLPCNWANAVYFSRQRRLYVGTIGGLGATDKNGNWFYRRGADYADKINGLYANARKKQKTRPPASSSLLPEDYITAITEHDGKIVLGFRARGACYLDDGKKNGGVILRPDGWITSFGHCGNALLAGTYGQGVVCLAEGPSAAPAPFPDAAGGARAFPSPARAALADLKDLLARLGEKGAATGNKYPAGAYVKDDWETRGDWFERYGFAFGLLCAANAPRSNLAYPFMYNLPYGVFGDIGACAAADDRLRHWVHWVKADDHNHDVLWAPDVGIRTEAEWDDHGEAYARGVDGPNILAFVDVPEGPHFVSLYFFNPNGRTPPNGERDFLLELYPVARKYHENSNELHLLDKEPLARARVSLFTGGVHKVFAVAGGGRYVFRIVRNHSFNTILNGVFISPVLLPEDVIKSSPFPGEGITEMRPLLNAVDFSQYPGEVLALWQKSFDADKLPLQPLIQTYLWRFVPEGALAAVIRWRLAVWTDAERGDFITAMRRRWDSYQNNIPCFRSKQFTPNSPNVVDFSVDELKKMELRGIDWRQFIGATPEAVERARRQYRLQ